MNVRVKKKNIESIYPLSPMQEGMLFHSIYNGDNKEGLYIEQTAMEIGGELATAAFKKAWQEIVNRHSIFRSAFIWEGVNEPVQVVKKDAELEINELDWSKLTEEEIEKELQKTLKEDKKRGLPFNKAPLMRLCLIHINPKRHILVNTNHHILSDAWSNSIMFRELFQLYQIYKANADITIPPAPPYRNYIKWLKKQDTKKAKEFWTEFLQGFEQPNRFSRTPTDIDECSEVICELDIELTETISRFAKKQMITLNTVIQGAWAILQSKYSQSNDVVFGIAVSGRPTDMPEADKIVGLFINTLPLRIKTDREETIIDWLKKIHNDNITMREYEYTPLATIQQLSDIQRGQPLFESMVTFENVPQTGNKGQTDNKGASAKKSSDQLTTDILMAKQRASVPIGLLAFPGDKLQLKLRYESLDFSEESASRMLKQLTSIFNEIVTNPHSKPKDILKNIDILTESEKFRIINDISTGANIDYEKQTISKMFESAASKYPDTIAVTDSKKSITYKELDQSANRLAHHISTVSQDKNSPIAFCIDRSIEQIITIIAILKSGNCYLPIDPTYPDERIEYLLSDSKAKIIITNGTDIDTSSSAVINLKEEQQKINSYPNTPPSVDDHVHRYAYIIYTSGSTGKPKGTLITHSNAINLYHALNQEIYNDIGNLKNITMNASISFDSVVKQIIQTLSGNTLHIISEECRNDPSEFLTYIKDNNIDVLDCTPRQLQLLLEQGELESVSAVLVGGEAIDISLWTELSNLDPIKFYNVYGPTECTVDTTIKLISKEDKSPTIGKPIGNVQTYVLDNNLDPVPVGVAGELFIGGLGVATGYLNRPDMTSEKFIPNPFSATKGERLYRSGDIVRYNRSGELEFQGRADNQIKIRGFRVELEEIESRISENDKVISSVVVAREDIPGAQRLIAYIATSSDQKFIDEIRQKLSESLPDFMIPSIYIFMDELPLNQHGKVDKSKLPIPTDQDIVNENNYIAPRNEIEENLTNIWSNTLGITKVGIQDDFFTLGGDSIQSIRVCSAAKKVGILITPRDIFECTTIEKISNRLSGKHEETQHNETKEREKEQIIPLSPQIDPALPNLYLAPPSGGSDCYRPLAAALSEHVNVYGLKPKPKTAPEQTIQETASNYVKLIKSMQKDGEYYVGGYSIGGYWAIETANQLADGDSNLKDLILIDCFHNIESKSSVLNNDSLLLSSLLVDMDFISKSEMDEILSDLSKKTDESNTQIIIGETLKKCSDQIKSNQLSQLLKTSKLPDEFYGIKRDYIEASTFSAKNIEFSATLIKSEEDLSVDDPEDTWRKTDIFNNLQTTVCPGNHKTMLHKPNVDKLAELIKNIILKKQI